MWSVSKKFKFSAAHVLPQHEGKCQRLHGHGYIVVVSARSPVLDEQSMVQDFGVIKKQVNELIEGWDHRFLVAQPYVEGLIYHDEYIDLNVGHGKHMIVPVSMCEVLPVPETTAEMLAAYIVNELQGEYGPMYFRCEVHETEDSVGVFETGEFSLGDRIRRGR